MTDKQIILDGVDVSGCPHYQTIGYLSQKDEGIKDYCNLFAYSCKNANCHYKEWQRKEQECERLKEQLTILDDEDVVVEITAKQFEEYKKLKQTLAEIKEIAKKQCNVCEALTPINEYKDCKKCWQGVILQKISECEVEDENK